MIEFVFSENNSGSRYKRHSDGCTQARVQRGKTTVTGS